MSATVVFRPGRGADGRGTNVRWHSFDGRRRHRFLALNAADADSTLWSSSSWACRSTVAIVRSSCIGDSQVGDSCVCHSHVKWRNRRSDPADVRWHFTLKTRNRRQAGRRMLPPGYARRYGRTCRKRNSAAAHDGRGGIQIMTRSSVIAEGACMMPHVSWNCLCSVNFTGCSFVLVFSRPRSEGWPHRGRTFSIYPCPLSFSLTLPPGVLSTSWCCPSRPCVAFLAWVHLTVFLALSLSPGSSLFPHGVTIVSYLPCFDGV